MNIREMNKDDWERVSAIYRQGMDSNKATFKRVVPPYADWDAAYKKECRFVAEVDGRVEGWIALLPVRPSIPVYWGVCEVSVYIDSAMQGKGLGTALLRRVIDASEEQGFWLLHSEIFADNEHSIRIHEKCGFRTLGVREKVARDMHGCWRDTVVMERRSPNIF